VTGVVIKVSPTTLNWRGFLASKTGDGGGQHRLVNEPCHWLGLLEDSFYRFHWVFGVSPSM
jgi:hypothetical protein